MKNQSAGGGGGGGSITYDSLGTATTVGYINGGPNTVTYTHTFGSSITDGTVLVMVACDYYLDASFTVDVGGVTASHVVSYWNWGGIEVFVATGLSGSSATVTITGPSGISDFGYDFTGWSVALTGVDQSTPTGNTATTEFQISGSVSVNSPSDGDYVFCAAHRYYRGTLSADISADEVAQGTFYIASIMNSVPYSAVLRQWSTGDPTSIGFTGTDALNPHYKATSIILNAA